MTASLCPNGHQSATADWCDTCGAPIGASPAPSPSADPVPPPPAPPPAMGTTTCAHCAAENPVDALFCEECGYDFTTGQAPPDPVSPSTPTSSAPSGVPTLGWVAEVSADRAWYELKKNDDTDPFPPDQLAVALPLAGGTALVGRASESRGIHPEIDAGADSAVSRRHAQLVGRGDGWQVVDLDSTNGTAVQRLGEVLPETSRVGGAPVPVGDGDSVLVGAWTRITLRRAADPATSDHHDTKAGTP